MNHIHTIASIIFILSMSPFLANRLKIPLTVVEILLGSLFTYLNFINMSEVFHILSEFGFLFLMFLAGIELNLKELLRFDKKMFLVTILYIMLLYLFSSAIVYALNINPILITMMTLISVGLLASLSKEYGSETPWVKLAFNVGSIGEIISIIIFTIISSKVSTHNTYEFYTDMVYLTTFIIGTIIVFKLIKLFFWWKPEYKHIMMPDDDFREQDYRLSISILFIFIIITSLMHIELAFGTFLAGILISTFFEHKVELHEKLSSLGFGFLVPVFLIATGSHIVPSKIANVEVIKMTILITISMFFVRIFASILFVRWYKIGDTILMALSHAMPLTLLIALATLLHKENIISPNLFYSIILSSIIEVLISMILINILHKRIHHENSNNRLKDNGK